MTLRELLLQKIDTPEKWAVVEMHMRRTHGTAPVNPNPMLRWDGRDYIAMPFWCIRESTRMVHNYQGTAVTAYLNNHSPFSFIHVALDDREKVAYTPDAASGVADRQLTISLGRLIVKLFPLFRDEYVQELVAHHLAEANFTIEYITDPLEIVKAYKTGPGSCMSKDNKVFNVKTDDEYPVAFYGNHDNLALAVCRDGNGRVNARCLVRRKDKLFIRNYGDSKLLAALKAEGYTPGSFQGLVFEPIPYTGRGIGGEVRQMTYVLPYLDANGGPNGGTNTAILNEDGKIYIPYSSEQELIRAAEYRLVGCSSTEGHAYFGEFNGVSATVPTSIYRPLDVLTGEPIQGKAMSFIFTGENLTTLSPTAASGDDLLARGYKLARNQQRGKLLPVTGYVPAETPTFSHHGEVDWIDNAYCRELLGYSLLSERYYGKGGWIRPAYSNKPFVMTHDAQLIPREDSVIVLYHDGDTGVREEVWHKSEVLEPTWLQVHSRYKDQPVYAADDVEVVYTAFTHRKVVVGYHTLVPIFGTDQYELSTSRKIREYTFLGRTYYLPVGTPIPAELTLNSENGAKLAIEYAKVNSYSSVIRSLANSPELEDKLLFAKLWRFAVDQGASRYMNLGDSYVQIREAEYPVMHNGVDVTEQAIRHMFSGLLQAMAEPVLTELREATARADVARAKAAEEATNLRGSLTTLVQQIMADQLALPVPAEPAPEQEPAPAPVQVVSSTDTFSTVTSQINMRRVVREHVAGASAEAMHAFVTLNTNVGVNQG